MVRAGDVIDNPILGDSIKVLQTPADTAGELFQAEITLVPNALGPPLHIHPTLEDRFLARTGSLGVEINGKRRVLAPAEEAVAPPGVPHRFWNAGDEPASFLAEVRPGTPGFIAFIETLYGLARDGKTNARGLPNPLQAAVLFRAYKDDVVPASPPPPLQPVLFGIMAAVGRLLGFRAYYPEYSKSGGTLAP